MSSWKDTVDVYNNQNFVTNYVQHNLESTRILGLLEKFVSKLSKKSLVLDLGCAHGRDSRYLSDFGVEKVVGVDYSSLFIDKAKRFSEKYKNIVFEIGDMRKLRFDDEIFDGVVCLATIQSLNEVDAELAVKEIYRVLKKDGVALIMTKVGFQDTVTFSNPDYVAGMEFTQQIWDEERFKELLESVGFEILEFTKGGGNPIAGDRTVYWGNFLLKKN